jgi:hypothetical protein
MLALSELAKCWPVGGWILRLFINLMRRLTGQGFSFDNSNTGGISGSGVHNTPIASKQSRDSSGLTPGQSGLSSAPIQGMTGKTATPQDDTLNASMPCEPDVGQQQQPRESDGRQQEFSRSNRQINMIQQADQLLSDALWADGGFDFDFLFQSASGSFLRSYNFGGMSGDPDISGF